MKLKLFWFYFNVAFIANYALALIKFVAYFPLPTLPNFCNALLLVGAYACTLAGAFKNAHGIFTNQNFICVLFFLTLPPRILLFPFFLLAIYHTNAFILLQKRVWGNTALFSAATFLGQYTLQIGRAALYSEVCAAFFALPLALLRWCSVKTFLMYCVVIRRQYTSNSTMQGIVSDILLWADRCAARAPGFILGPYNKIKQFARAYPSPPEAAKKAQ